MYKINIYLLTFINKIFFKHYFIVLFKQTHTQNIWHDKSIEWITIWHGKVKILIKLILIEHLFNI